MRWCPDSPQGFGLPMIWLETWANCKTILECFKVLNYVACFEHAGLPIVLLINFFAHRNYNLHPEKQHKNGKPLSFPEEIHLQIVDVHGPFQSHVGFPEHSNMSPPHGDVFFFSCPRASISGPRWDWTSEGVLTVQHLQWENKLDTANNIMSISWLFIHSEPNV